MNKLFNCCLLTAFLITAIFLSFLSCNLAELSSCRLVSASVPNLNSISDSEADYGVTRTKNMVRDDNAYYSGGAGGELDITPDKAIGTAYILSIRIITIVFSDLIVSLQGNYLHTMSLCIDNGIKSVAIDGEVYPLQSDSLTMKFKSFGVFGDFAFETYTTYHDKTVTARFPEGYSQMSDNYEISDNMIIMTPDAININGDTVTHYLALDSEMHLFCYRLINRRALDVYEINKTGEYSINDNYDAISVEPDNSDASAVIDGNKISFDKSGNYTVILTLGYHITKIHLTVNLKDEGDAEAPPNPDGGNLAPPDGEGVTHPDENENGNGNSAPEGNGGNNDSNQDGGNNDNANTDDGGSGDINQGDSGMANQGENKPAPPDEDNGNISEPTAPDDGSEIPPANGSESDNEDKNIGGGESNNDNDGENESSGVDNGDDAPPYTDENPPDTAGGNGYDSSDGELPSFDIEYSTETDYAKIAVISAAALLFAAGLCVTVFIAVKIAKRRK